MTERANAGAQEQQPKILPISSVTSELSRYMAAAAERSVPAEAVEKTKHHILDTLAAMLSGQDLPPAKVALRFAQAYGADKGVTIVGTNILCGPMEAALVNGVFAHSDETDDSHALSHSHPGCSTVPAALVASEQFGADGARFLRAVTLGYDIGTRVTATFGGLKYQMQSHFANHCITGNFCAAAAAGCIAGFNAQQMRYLLDYTGQQASGVVAWQRDTEHVEKALVFAGWPARNALTTAIIISLGGTGVDDIFSGADNFLLAFAPNADPAGLIEKLGERYEITRTMIKKWSVGSPIQAVLDAIQLLMKQRPFEADEVQKVIARVATSEAKTVNNREMPNICLQHMAAVMLVDKTVSFHASHDKPRMQDPAILKQRAKVQLVPDEELELLYPQRVAVVEITLNDGAVLNQRVEAVRGTVENPMTREDIVAKSRHLIEPVLGADKCKRLIETVFDLENVKDIRALRPLLQRA